MASKTAQAQPPGPPGTLSERQIAHLQAGAVIGALSIITIIVMSILIITENEYGTMIDYPMRRLTHSVVETYDRYELMDGPPMKIAEGTENVKEEIRKAEETFEKLKIIYKNLFEKTPQNRSGPWNLHRQNLYYFGKGEKTWYDAENYCVSREAHLASVLSDEEQDYISSKIEGRSWIGLSDENREGVWEWTDGSKLQKLYWSDDELGRIQSAGGDTDSDCTWIESSSTHQNWNSDDCYKLHGWVCKQKQAFK